MLDARDGVSTIQMYSSTSTITLNMHEYDYEYEYSENKCTRVRVRLLIIRRLSQVFDESFNAGLII